MKTVIEVQTISRGKRAKRVITHYAKDKPTSEETKIGNLMGFITRRMNDRRAPSRFEITGSRFVQVVIRFMYDDCDEYWMAEYQDDLVPKFLGYTPDNFDCIRRDTAKNSFNDRMNADKYVTFEKKEANTPRMK